MDVPDTPEPEDYSSLSLPALIEKSDELRAEVERMSQQVATSSSTDIVHVSTTANDLKVSLAIARSTLMSKQAELERVAAALKRKMEIEQAKIAGVVGPMRKQIAMLEEGLWSVSLYLGSGEEIVQIADGDPADIDEPISIRQEILAMDEQMMDIWDGEGLDARHVELFDEWLLDPENLALVLPERRGVIVFRPRRAPRNYGDTFFQKVMDEANKQSYWLIRNGDRLWRMTTNIQVGLHLVPKDDEFEKPFWVEDYSSRSAPGRVLGEQGHPRDLEGCRLRRDAGARCRPRRGGPVMDVCFPILVNQFTKRGEVYVEAKTGCGQEVTRKYPKGSAMADIGLSGWTNDITCSACRTRLKIGGGS